MQKQQKQHPLRQQQKHQQQQQQQDHQLRIGEQPTQQQQYRQNSRMTSVNTAKQVRFSQYVGTTAPGPLSIDEARNLWYDQESLDAFKRESKQQQQEQQQQRQQMMMPLASTSPDKRENANNDNGDDDDDDGKKQERRIRHQHEHQQQLQISHCSQERAKYIRMTIQCILSAYKKGVGDETTAGISRKCTAWCVEVACIQAAQTYCSIYAPNLASQIPKTPDVPEFPFSMKKRKPATIHKTHKHHHHQQHHHQQQQPLRSSKRQNVGL